MYKKLSIVVVIMSLLVTSCSSKEIETVDTKTLTCMNGVIDYIDTFMWDGINYIHVGDLESGNSQGNTMVKKGKKLGEISYTLADGDCADYRKTENGDATYLPIGSKVYEVEGYKTNFRLFAGDKLYQSHDNPNASRVSDLYDIAGKVTRISSESKVTGQLISYFSEEATEAFVEEYLQLAYLGEDTLLNTGKGPEAEGVEFLRFHLNDVTSFRIVYMTEENLISPGAAGSERMLAIMEEYIQSRKPLNK